MAQKSWNDKFFSQIKQPISSLLDVGCGDGYVSTKISPKKFLGIDKNEGIVECARSEYETPAVKFMCGDITTLILNEKFDAVTCFSVLHWIKEIHLALNNIYNLCETGANVYIIVAAKSDDNIFGECISAELVKNGIRFDEFLFEYDVEGFTQVAQQANFKVQDIGIQENDYTFVDRNEFFEYLQSASPVEFSDQTYVNITNSYVEKTGQTDTDCIHYTDKLLYAILVKE